MLQPVSVRFGQYSPQQQQQLQGLQLPSDVPAAWLARHRPFNAEEQALIDWNFAYRTSLNFDRVPAPGANSIMERAIAGFMPLLRDSDRANKISGGLMIALIHQAIEKARTFTPNDTLFAALLQGLREIKNNLQPSA